MESVASTLYAEQQYDPEEYDEDMESHPRHSSRSESGSVTSSRDWSSSSSGGSSEDTDDVNGQDDGGDDHDEYGDTEEAPTWPMPLGGGGGGGGGIGGRGIRRNNSRRRRRKRSWVRENGYSSADRRRLEVRRGMG